MKRAHLVGAGGMGRAWARTLSEHPEVEIVAWTDVRPGAAAQAAAEMHLSPHTGIDFEADLLHTRPDFVVDVTPPEVHEDITIRTLNHGLPVLGEKPMSVSLESARRMVAASEAAGKLYMVSQSRRYDGGLVAFREAVHALGEVGILNGDFYLGPHFGGFRDEMPSPLVLDMAIHTFDAARFLLAGDPVSVYCDEFNPGWSWYQGNAAATAIFEFSDGARFTYRGSWCAEGCNTSWDTEWRAVGSRGSALWDGFETIVRESPSSTEGFLRPVDRWEAGRADVLGGIQGSLAEFLAAIEGGPTPQGECHDNFKSLAMVFAAVESARRGEKVPIESL